MNIYFIGMCISFILYIIIGLIISRKVKDVKDYYVAGRRAPVILVGGSLIASYTGTSLFMGDGGQCYDGGFAAILTVATMQTAGYVFGAVFFGRYLRRSKALTIPEFFGKRFASVKIKKLAAITALVILTVYLLSITQGIGTLMSVVTGIDYNVCMVTALLVCTIITIIAGSSGVLITDTIMACIFTGALLFAVVAIVCNAGGWYDGIHSLLSNPATQEHLSWTGAKNILYESNFSNFVWAFVYGIVWMSVCMVGPWQSSRYLMAKNEHTVVKSSIIAIIGIFVLQFLSGIGAVFVNVLNPELENSSHVFIWAAMNAMPKILGVVLLTGILAAGISSATTFLSLIGASVANDLMEAKDKKAITAGRWTMLIVSIVVLLLAIFNPPAIFWIMYLSSTIVASAWMPVAIGCVFSKRLTKTGAFCGMLAGFVSFFVLRLFIALSGVELPVYLDPAIVGMVFNIIFMVIGSACTHVSEEEKTIRIKMFEMPESEKNPLEIKKTLKWSKAALLIGPAIVVTMLILWVIPCLK